MYKTLTTFTRALSRRTTFLHSHTAATDRDNHFRSMSGFHLLPVAPPPPLPPTPIITNTFVNKDEFGNFMAMFPDIVRVLTKSSLNLNVPDVTEWLENLLQYNVPGGKNNRGLMLVMSFKMLSSPSDQTDENLRLSYILGWCVEILQAYQLVLDDIMDNAITRRGRPCWYRYNDVGLMAVNDGILLEQAIYQLLKKYFKDKPYYTHILELFYDVTMKSAMGQCLDMLTAKSFKSKKLEKYTMKNYNSIVKYKTAYYSFFLPVCLAMSMTNINDQDLLTQAKAILLDMGQLFQVQDDFLDCYGNPNVTGKIGTDIEDGKCSWLAVKALQKVNSEQKKIMEDNYGIDDPANVAVIKDLYEQLKLQKSFLSYEEGSYILISIRIRNLPHDLSRDMLLKFLEKIHKRTH